MDEHVATAECPRDAALRDGTRVCVRAIRPDDKQRLAAAFAGLSTRSVRRRFLHTVTALDAGTLRFLTEVDMCDHVALVLTIGEGDEERLIAVGRFVRSANGGNTAEVAFTVADEYQNRGAASLMLTLLIRMARARNIGALVAHMLEDNPQMLSVLQRSELPLRQTCEDGVRTVVVRLAGCGCDDGPRRTTSIATERRRFADDARPPRA